MPRKPEKRAKPAKPNPTPFVPFSLGASRAAGAGDIDTNTHFDAAIDALKVALAKKSQISDVFTQFFDTLGENPAFLAMGTSSEPPERVLPALQSLASQVFPNAPSNHAVRVDLRMVRIAHQGFWHGGCTINGKIGTLLFFEDLEMSAIALHRGGSDVLYSRFTIAPYDKEGTPPIFHGRTPGEIAH